MEFVGVDDVQVTLLNVFTSAVPGPHFHSITGDARDMSGFYDGQFDVVFSNSVIEHVGGYEEQRQMASEVQRVGKRYFVQTPNVFFPLEPHFLFPFFQFLPASLKAIVIRHFDLGWSRLVPDEGSAIKEAALIRLLSEREIGELFPGGMIYRERFLGLVKSFIVYGGWDSL